MKVFVPFSEELARQHPDLIRRLVPYRPGLPCVHQAAADRSRKDQPPPADWPFAKPRKTAA